MCELTLKHTRLVFIECTPCVEYVSHYGDIEPKVPVSITYVKLNLHSYINLRGEICLFSLQN